LGTFPEFKDRASPCLDDIAPSGLTNIGYEREKIECAVDQQLQQMSRNPERVLS
jgi:hypothetical protein